jgi:hypothetical protein
MEAIFVPDKIRDLLDGAYKGEYDQNSFLSNFDIILEAACR